MPWRCSRAYAQAAGKQAVVQGPPTAKAARTVVIDCRAATFAVKHV